MHSLVGILWALPLPGNVSSVVNLLDHIVGVHGTTRFVSSSEY